MDSKRVLFWLSVALKLYFTDSLECYSCTNVSHVASCLTTTTCHTGQTCHTDVISNMYTLGCKDSGLCPIASTSHHGGSTSHPGRSTSHTGGNTSPQVGSTTTSHPGGSAQLVGRALTTNAGCSECCSTGMCNRQLCQKNDSSCNDSGHIDCAVTGSFANLCAEKEHAKRECRKFCGLCSMEDGGWSSWSAWASCSSTCGNGTVSRTRSCTIPAPADGGSDCIGATSDNTPCSNTTVCPVNGGWSEWSTWDICSVTCGICLQHRNRICSNPYPSNSGAQCVGYDRDDQICLSRACQDGGWTDWGGWSTCSKTCDTGTKKRSRSCTKPPPSVLGRYCTGDSSEMDTCVVKSCLEQDIGFTVQGVKNTTTSGGITFTDVVTNLGGGYNTTTGEFSCSVAGVYSFTLTLEKMFSVKHAFCYIYKNSERLGRVDVDGLVGYVPGSTTVYVQLQPGDIVSTQSCSAASSILGGSHSTFTGYLIHSG